jgi:hypothetical protein
VENTKVAVVNPANGQQPVAPVVDLLGNPKSDVDLTFGAAKLLGATGNDRVHFSIVGAGDVPTPQPDVNIDTAPPPDAAAMARSVVPVSDAFALAPSALVQSSAAQTPAEMVEATAHRLMAAQTNDLLNSMSGKVTAGEARKTLGQWLPHMAINAAVTAAKLHAPAKTSAGAVHYFNGDDGAVYSIAPDGTKTRNGEPIDEIPDDVKLSTRAGATLDSGELFKTADEAVQKVNEYAQAGTRAAAIPVKGGYKIRTFAEPATPTDSGEVLKTSDDVLAKIDEFADQGIPAHSVAVKGGFKVVTAVDRPQHVGTDALVGSQGNVVYQSPAAAPKLPPKLTTDYAKAVAQ